MIQYTVRIEEKPTGEFTVEMSSPPVARVTRRERWFAEQFAGLVKTLLEAISDKTGGSVSINKEN